MDAPRYSWGELVTCAANRDAWSSLVQAIKGPRVHIAIQQPDPAVHHTYITRSRTARARSDPAAQHSPEMRSKAQKANRSESNISAAKYRARDTHEVFFRRPALLQKGKPKKKRPKKSPPLTNKERHQFARDHYRIHHGSSISTTPSIAAT